MASIGGNGHLTNFNNRIQLFGASSGLNIQGLIEANLQMARLKIDPYYDTQDYYKQEKTIWGQFKTQLNDVLSKANELKNLTNINQASTYSKEGFVSVTAQGDAVAGNYNISVQQLAMSHKIMGDAMASSTEALGFSGALNIEGKDIQIQSSMNLVDIAKEINKAQVGADATVVGGHLFLTSTETGVASRLDIARVGGGSTATLSDNTNISATIVGDTSALNPQYSLEVQQLATTHKIQSNVSTNTAQNLNYSGTFTINGEVFTAETKDSIDTLVGKINANANVGVTASVVGGRMVLESKTTGAASAIQMTDDTTSVSKTNSLFQQIGVLDATKTSYVNEVQAANDAQFTIDGVSYTSTNNKSTDLAGIELNFKAVTTTPVTLTIDNSGIDIAERLGLITTTDAIKNEIQVGQDAMYTIEGISRTSSTNTITDAVADMTFELLKETTENIEINVKQNDEALTEKMKDFVTTYNKAMQFINDTSKQEGIFQGESLIRNAKTALRSILYETGTNNMMMFQVGMEGNGTAKDGTIKLDETKFKEALKNDYENVITFLTGQDGVAKKFYDKIYEFTKATGMIDTKTESLDRSIKRLDDTIERKEMFYEKLQDSLVNKYSKMESMLNAMGSQMAFMSAQLGNTSGDK